MTEVGTQRRRRFARKLVDERHALRAFANGMKFGPIIIHPDWNHDLAGMRAKDAMLLSRCARCGQWIRPNQYILKAYFKTEPKLTVWVHKWCNLFAESEWISGADYDYVVAIARGVTQKCKRCATYVRNGDIYHVTRNIDTLFVDHICKECVRE